ncbi:unnamed protein product [Didymodactylos carnosus]|uniref:Uncharacterized protein n=1 Tax=Didymodactylos carnosus TaxID=1234261 RepID=A0A814NQ41_9BILA|nr:unnamed protein product [Didymodactylos carnosus]CAF1114416.1 unnamed protein product [Didymodactylos carnosus]CAF3862077.1 unnamed protein product [Didymodactylos carnosus]CAF3883803.1 unnamed protein product [Didymodactylos carnosus]
MSSSSNSIQPQSDRLIRKRAQDYFSSNKIVTKLEDVLNEMFYDQPDDYNGYLANYFLSQSRNPIINDFLASRSVNKLGELALQLETVIQLRNKSQCCKGVTITVPLISHDQSTSTTTVGTTSTTIITPKEEDNRRRQSEYDAALIHLEKISQILRDANLNDQRSIDEQLSKYLKDEIAIETRRQKEQQSTTNTEVENTQNDPDAEQRLKVNEPKSKQRAISPKEEKTPKSGPAKKPATKTDTVEFVLDDPKSITFPGQFIITAISLATCLAANKIQQTSLFYTISKFVDNDENRSYSLPIPCIPILQSGQSYPGKQSIVKQYMLLPTPTLMTTDNWLDKVYLVAQNLRENLITAKGGSVYKPEQGIELIQTTLSTLFGQEHLFDLGLNFAAHEIFDYSKSKKKDEQNTIRSPKNKLKLKKQNKKSKLKVSRSTQSSLS